jgi:hypothetical protein
MARLEADREKQARALARLLLRLHAMSKAKRAPFDAAKSLAEWERWGKESNEGRAERRKIRERYEAGRQTDSKSKAR